MICLLITCIVALFAFVKVLFNAGKFHDKVAEW